MSKIVLSFEISRCYSFYDFIGHLLFVFDIDEMQQHRCFFSDDDDDRFKPIRETIRALKASYGEDIKNNQVRAVKYQNP
jgi:hypothetical protein